MADIQELMASKYSIDIRKVNLLKLYNITDPQISPAEMEALFAEARSRWEKGAQGSNENFARRDQERLAKADTYEAILRDAQLRQQLFAFYNGKDGDPESEVSPLVRRYFDLISRTRKIGRDELHFFLQYFPEEKTRKKSIQAFLKKEYKGLFSKKQEEKNDSGDAEKPPVSGKAPGRKSPRKQSGLVENLFSEETILALRQCELQFQGAGTSSLLLEHQPDLSKSFYEFLGIGAYSTAEQFLNATKTKADAIFTARQEFGTEYLPLMDLYNVLVQLLSNADVRDNFREFQLLVMYPALTPYMYEIGEIKKDSLEQLYTIAASEYEFRSMPHFLLNYFNVVYDNFGIYENAVQKIMADAEKRAGKERVLDTLSGWLGSLFGKNMPMELKRVYALAYWPILLLAGLFRISKFLMEKLRNVGIAAGILICLYQIISGVMDYGIFGLLTQGMPWKEYICEMMNVDKFHWLLWIPGIFQALILSFLVYFSIGGFVGYACWVLSVQLRKRFDLKGLDRTFTMLLEHAKKRTMEQYAALGQKIWSKKMPLILMNLATAVILIIMRFSS